jgi:hypothetical protein
MTPGLQRLQRVHEERGLAGAGAGDEVQRQRLRRREELAIDRREAVVLLEDVALDADQAMSVLVSVVMIVSMTVLVIVMVIVVMVVMRVPVAVRMIVSRVFGPASANSTHHCTSSSTTRISSPLVSIHLNPPHCGHGSS